MRDLGLILAESEITPGTFGFENAQAELLHFAHLRGWLEEILVQVEEGRVPVPDLPELEQVRKISTGNFDWVHPPQESVSRRIRAGLAAMMVAAEDRGREVPLGLSAFQIQKCREALKI